MAKKGFGTIASMHGIFDQIMVSEPTATIIRADIGKQEFTTSHFDTKTADNTKAIRCD
jgi:hypothetical protein